MEQCEKDSALVSAENLVKAYRGRRVVNNVSINVHAGEVVGLLGPNGAGKTTSFYMVMGLISPDSGSLHFRGIDITHVPMYQRARLGMGYLAQEPSIFRKLTVEENIMAILETLDLTRAERAQRCAQLLEELELTRLAKQKAMTLSGGERRRLEITRALVTNPLFIMLDEPFSGVDPLAVYDVQQIILRLKERNLGILITDHNVRETLSVVDRAYLMCMGQILIEGTSEFLVNDKKAQEVYLGPAFSNDENFKPGSARKR
ncbi:MAG: LPS export ABC transporter ATP-binding protein [Victivallaceae bacterium]|nr:LPS export ABC transporter ATP-binding protein [Victivallaceae bacterium]